VSTLVIEHLSGGLAGSPLVEDVSLTIRSGEVHALMGPNGAGKSTLGRLLMGHPGCVATAGSVRLDGVELLSLPTWRRAAAGLFFAPQDPTEVPGVALDEALAEALAARGAAPVARESLAERLREVAGEISLPPALLERALNVDASGGEKKRLETLQLAVLAPRFAVLDELDSGLDVDALRDVARAVARAARPPAGSGSSALGVLAITHYRRLLDVLEPDAVHVLVQGRIVRSGGPELADEIERAGYGAYSAAGA